MEWIEHVKRTVTVPQVTGWLGMDGRGRAKGPCPACRADRRSRQDSRLPIGLNSRMDGWECHACGAKGDVVELAAHGVLGRSSNEIQGSDWDKLRSWFAERGVDTSHAAAPGRTARAGVRSVGSMVGSILGGQESPGRRRGDGKPSGVVQVGEEPESAPGGAQGAGGGLYGWEVDLVPRCEAALWADTPEAVRARAYLLEYRRLSEEAVRVFRLGLYVGPDGRPHVIRGRPVVVIPLIDADERPVSAKFRSVPVPGTCEECGGVPGGCKKCRDYRNCKGRPLPLYGSHRLSAERDIPVVMVEGEMDVLAAYTYGLKVNVVSTTAGAGAFADEWLDLLEPYDAIVGLYDADEKGDAGFLEVAEKLGAYRCERALPPGGHKDIGDCLIAGVEQERVARSLGRAKPMHGIEVRKADAFGEALEDLIANPGKLRGVPTGLESLDEVLGGWRPGLVIITGETGQGKTTFATAQLLALARVGHGVMLTSFEQTPVGTVQKLLRNEVGGDFTRVTPETRRSALESIAELPLWIVDHYGHLTPAKMVETIRYAKRRFGVQFFLIDHLGFLVDPEADDERRAIEAVVRAMAIVAKQQEVTLFLVAHPHNTGRDHKGKAVEVTGRDLKGASAIRQDADDILVVSQIVATKATPWPRAKVKADKVRSEFGVSGGEAILAFDPGSNVYADRWEQTPAGERGLLVPRARGVNEPQPQG